MVLTGAGISAESGVPTFRGAGGLWEGHRVEEVATPEAFARDPVLVHRFYNERRRRLLDGIEPNAAHRALARLEAESDHEVVIVTQNIDDLHERGGARRVLHMHGQLLMSRCGSCGRVGECREDLSVEMRCGGCGREGGLRPHIVWFGEIPFHLEEIEHHLQRARLFLSVGTSGNVYPAAGFATLAKCFQARTVEVNLEETEGSEGFDESHRGKAGEVLPGLVEAILRGEA